nr:alpha-amylase family glycosyl hydrolase [uncultured Rhodopila sp.]
MCPALVQFSYRPGLKSNPFSKVRLIGSWDANGAPASDWSSTAMHPAIDPDGCPCFEAEVAFDPAHAGTTFSWGVRLDGPAGTDLWGIASEVDDEASTARQLSFVLQSGSQTAFYYLTCCYRLGAIKLSGAGRFSLWAPNAQAVDLALADPARGYIADDGEGALQHLAMTKGDQGIWSIGPANAPALANFASLAGTPYMFRVTKDDGSIAYRTDMFSRMQIGAGQIDPEGKPYAGPPEALDGPHSCSVVCDTDAAEANSFWRDEFVAKHPLPTNVQDLVIYELHVGALGFGKPDAGTLDDAMALLDHLTALGINAVELMPISEFEDIANWGYGTAQFLAIDQAAGGTERLMAFVKACHQRGIVVILDVCYNHFDPNADRAEWAYDSNDPTRNIYFWYEGKPSDYPSPDGGYIDNISSGWAPRFDQEMVRQVFISSAAWFVDRCHVDGFRLDQTSSIHQYPTIHANGQQASRAAAFGTKFLKQWTRTMRLLKPGLFLSAEDYSDWDAMTQPSLNGDGLGFDVTWYGEFHHNLVEYQGGNYAELVKQSGYGDNRPLQMDYFAGALRTSANAKVVYTESHDDCGNRPGSARTIVLAVNGAAQTGETRRWAEARQRFAAGMALLSAGTPMFFMGEEIGAQKPYTYDTFLQNREDILGDSLGTGALLFAYYKDLVRLSVENAAIRSRNIDVAVTGNADRVIAFHRWDGSDEVLVVGSLSDTAFSSGYWLHGDRIGDAGWTEVFNSDAQSYGGWNIGNDGQRLQAENGALNVIIPAAGLVVLRRT